jgi:hypothetical protein
MIAPDEGRRKGLMRGKSAAHRNGGGGTYEPELGRREEWDTGVKRFRGAGITASLIES